MIEPSLALYGDAFARVDRLLEELLEVTGVRYGLLVDRKGFVLSHKEALWAPRPPALDSVATLVASNAAATAALANMLGERTFSEQTHQGENGTLYVESVGDQALLTLIFDVGGAAGQGQGLRPKDPSCSWPPFWKNSRTFRRVQLESEISQGCQRSARRSSRMMLCRCPSHGRCCLPASFPLTRATCPPAPAPGG